jgi:hypothetical protein
MKLRWIIVIATGGLAAMAVWALTRSEPEQAAPADGLAVPSGQSVSYLDTVQTAPGPEGLTIRFRFVAPGIARDGGAVTAQEAQDDMAWLCDHFAIKRLPATGPVPEQVVISLSDRPVDFGAAAPDATQYFEAFRVEGDTCHWEAF